MGFKEGRNNYDLTCGGVVDDALFVGGRECELTRWDLKTRAAVVGKFI